MYIPYRLYEKFNTIFSRSTHNQPSVNIYTTSQLYGVTHSYQSDPLPFVIHAIRRAIKTHQAPKYSTSPEANQGPPIIIPLHSYHTPLSPMQKNIPQLLPLQNDRINTSLQRGTHDGEFSLQPSQPLHDLRRRFIRQFIQGRTKLVV